MAMGRSSPVGTFPSSSAKGPLSRLSNMQPPHGSCSGLVLVRTSISVLEVDPLKHLRQLVPGSISTFAKVKNLFTRGVYRVLVKGLLGGT